MCVGGGGYLALVHSVHQFCLFRQLLRITCIADVIIELDSVI